MAQYDTSGQSTGSTESSKSRIQEIGNFELITKLGQGGMGTVYKARQKSLDRIVALKVLPPSIAKNAEFTERFQREARASAKLNHAHIVQGIDVGQDTATKLWYFAMEFIDGPTLQQVLTEQGKLEEERALKFVKEVASALECVAAAGMVHRDIKPDNILLSSNDTAKLADLGLAKEINDDASLTQSGNAVGTPLYMAPEQVRGELTQCDIRTDIYALGATLFHLVTGQPPFSGPTSAVIMTKHLTEAPPKASSINPKVSAGCSKLIERMMQKKKEQRVQTPGEVINLIQKILAGEDIAKGMTTGPRDPVLRSGATTGPRDPIIRRATTGPRDPITASSTSTRAKSVPKSSKIPLYAGGAALVVTVFALIAMSGGSDDIKKDSGSSSPSATNDRKASLPNETAKVAEVTKAPVAKPAASKEREERKLEDLVSAALAYEKSNPDHFDEVLSRLEKASSALDGSSLKQKLEPELLSAINRVQARRSEAAADAWSKLSTTADAAAQAGDYDAALKALTELPKALEEVLSDKALSKAAALRKEGEGKLEPALKQASAAADPSAGLKALESVEKIQISPLSTRVKQLKTRLESEFANAGELERKQAELVAGKKLEEYLTRFDSAIIDDGDFQKAREAVGAASRDSALKSVSAQIEGMKAVVAALDEIQRTQEKALLAQKGKPFTVGKDKGTIEKVEGGFLFVSIKLDGGKLTATKKVAVKDLSDEQRSSLFRTEMPDSPGAKVGSAMLKLAKGREDLEGALALLGSAGDFALAGRYRELIRVRQVGVAEATAEKAWALVTHAAGKPCDTAEQGQALLDAVDKYLKDHEQTEFAQLKKKDIEAIREKANRVVDVSVFLSDMQETEVKVGYGKFSKHGDLGYENQRIKVNGAESPNAISMHPPSNGLSRVTYKLDGRFRKFSAQAALNDSCGLGNRTPIVFKVLGDGNVLWESQPIQRSTQKGEYLPTACDVDITGVTNLQLVVDCPGSYNYAHAVWLEPRVSTIPVKKK